MDQINSRFIKNSLSKLLKEYKDFTSEVIPELENPPSSLSFLREYVSKSFPVKIRNGFKNWSGLQKWSSEYLSSKLADNLITVAVTPNGLADSIDGDLFMLPEERKMTFENFETKLQNFNEDEVFYIQQQNNNFIHEFQPLHGDIEKHIPFATEAFGEMPEVVNFWMGDQRAFTSMHKDHYENIYCVLNGSKTFILQSPVSTAFIPYEKFRTGVFCYEFGNWTRKKLDQDIYWIPIDARKPDIKKYPSFKEVTSYYCTLEKGDMLYLPAMWYHSVSQTHSTIAVNFWYNMSFDIKYCYFKFLEDFRDKLLEVK